MVQSLQSTRWKYSTLNNTIQYQGSMPESCLSTQRSRLHSLTKLLARKTGFEAVKKTVFIIEERKETEMEFIITKTAYNRLRAFNLLFDNTGSIDGERFIRADGSTAAFSCR